MNMTEQYQQRVSDYIQAKDGNRPWAMAKAFLPDAELQMQVDTDNIDFPARVIGLDAITDTLVRSFGRENDNVFTFCLQDTLVVQQEKLMCDWVVFMTDKDTGRIRVGWGQYHWDFADQEGQALAKALLIRIQQMDILSAAHQAELFSVLDGMPYPWLSKEQLLAAVSDSEYLRNLSDFLAG